MISFYFVGLLLVEPMVEFLNERFCFTDFLLLALPLLFPLPLALPFALPLALTLALAKALTLLLTKLLDFPLTLKLDSFFFTACD